MEQEQPPEPEATEPRVTAQRPLELAATRDLIAELIRRHEPGAILVIREKHLRPGVRPARADWGGGLSACIGLARRWLVTHEKF